jgi:hypothetical protein
LIEVLASLRIFTVKMKFGFISDAERKKFQKLYSEEENDEYNRDVGYVQDNKSKIELIENAEH